LSIGRNGSRERVEVALIGSGIGQSLSPALHEREGRLLGFEYSYALRDLDQNGTPPEDVGSLVAALRAEGFRGLNVTHPCKQLVVPALDALAPEAEILGAVNTVVFSEAGAVGHNTDWSGFQRNFAAGLPEAATDRVVLVGAGGAGAAVAHALLALGTGNLTVIDREAASAEELASRLCGRYGAGRAAASDLDDIAGAVSRADGLVHATPLGMHGDGGSAVPAELLRQELWVADVVYMPLATQLLRDARAAGCRTLDGGGMVAHQAADSLELFTGVAPDRQRMVAHLAELVAPQREEAACERQSQPSR
jgi:shikimate dehydrogenase